jgi:hypothetical protein
LPCCKLKIKEIGETSSTKVTATERELQLSGSIMTTQVSTQESPQLPVVMKVSATHQQLNSTDGTTSHILREDKL